MLSERPIATDHICNWVCLERKSPEGELATLTPLTQQAISLIQKDVSNIEKVCPHGVIVCSICDRYFNEAQKAKDGHPDVNSLAKRLIKKPKFSGPERTS